MSRRRSPQKRDHHRKPKRATASTPSATMFSGYDAATWTPARPLPFWPTLETRQEVDSFDCWALWTGARALYANSSDIRMVVKTIVDLVGYLTPMPATKDHEWNALAAEAFRRRAGKAALFDASGRLDWQDASRWLVRRSIIDGDALAVLSKAPDGGAQFRFYPANQIWGDGEGGFQLGCKVDRAGRILEYRLVNAEDVRTVQGFQAVLFQMEPDSGRFRGISGLVSAINDAVDLKDFDNLTKASAKLAASYAIIETKDINDTRAEMQGAIQQRMLSNLAGNGAADAGADSPALPPFTPLSSNPEPFSVNGSTVASLAPGRDLKVLHDSRPSNEVQSYMRDVKARLAYALGFDPSLVYYVSDLGSAGVRYALQRNRRTLQTWRHQLQKVSDRLYKHVIACEVAAGRLRPCNDEHWTAVDWIPLNDLTIDVGRDTTALLNKYREGLISPDRLTIPTDGVPAATALEAKADFLALASRLAQEKGVPLSLLLPGALGSTAPTPEPAQEN